MLMPSRLTSLPLTVIVLAVLAWAVFGSVPTRATGRGVLFQLVIAFYIGYFGAGAGILILAMLALLGMDDIHSMNALKALLTTISNGVALVMFIFSHAVYWPEAILMIVASMLGGYFGAHFAQKTKPEHVRMMVIVIGFALTAYYFGKQLLH